MDDASGSRDSSFQHVLFVASHGLSTAEAEVLLKQWGRNELVEKVSPTWLLLSRQVLIGNPYSVI
jgi:H+-transporting ATPase